MQDPVRKYPLLMRALHWAMALVILGLIVMGWFMSGIPKEEEALRAQLYGLHKSFGALALILFFFRLGVRLAARARVPALPAGMKAWEKQAAALGHAALYLFMLIVPLSGYMMSNAHGYGVALFGLPLPMLFPKNEALADLTHEAHEILPYLLLALLGVHVAGVIKHRFMDAKENDVLPRMV